MFTEGEIPEKPEEETPKPSEGETLIMFAEGKIPKQSGGDEVPIIAEEQGPKDDGPLEIVDLDDAPEDSPVKCKELRRKTRRSLLDEVDDVNQTQEPRFFAQEGRGAQEEAIHGSEENIEEAEGSRLALERKRKGKHVATPRPRKSKRVASIREEESPLPVPIKVPYIKGQAVFGSGSPAVEYKSEEEEVPNYERTEIWVTKKLLASMAKFDDPKRA